MKTSDGTNYVGVDVCKAKPGVHCRQWDSVAVFNNGARGIRSLLGKLARQTDVHPVCEATGGYGKKIVAAAHKAGVAVSPVNPAKVRHYAKAAGN